VSTSTLPADDAFISNVVVVHVSLADFLFMYSGEATAAEIVGMCMSGRVSVPWKDYGRLKYFAESFDFSSEKWEQYYAAIDQTSSTSDQNKTRLKCCKPCCQATTKDEIDANWLLVSDSSCNNAIETDWELISDCQCHIIPKENRAKMEEIFGVPQIDDWLSKLCRRHLNKNRMETVQNGVKNSISDLKALANKLIVNLAMEV